MRLFLDLNRSTLQELQKSAIDRVRTMITTSEDASDAANMEFLRQHAASKGGDEDEPGSICKGLDSILCNFVSCIRTTLS